MSTMSTLDLKKWPILSMLESEFLSHIRMALVFGESGAEALVVTRDDCVYGLGTNKNGCLGLAVFSSTLIPQKVEALCGKGVIKFAYGGSNGPHVLALTKSGQIYAWGYNENHELGDSSTMPSSIPTLVTKKLENKTIVDIACGHHHSLVLTSDGEVYAWGKKFGENTVNLEAHRNLLAGTSTRNSNVIFGSPCTLGTNHPLPPSPSFGFNFESPTVVIPKTDLWATYFVSKFAKLVSIACGPSSCYVINDNGTVYTWGQNNMEQRVDYSGGQSIPIKVRDLAKVQIEKIVCGYSHVMALSKDGVLYTWGGNSYGELGIGNKESKSSPVAICVMGRIVDITASHYAHISGAMNEKGEVFMWGQCRGQAILNPTCTSFSNLHDVLAHFSVPGVMYKPLEIHQEGEMNITKCIKQAFDDSETSDFTIEVEGKPIHVHKSILMIRSIYFKNMFLGDWLENKQRTIKHEQFSYEAYKLFLKYLYTDELDTSAEIAFDILNLANQYMHANLKQRCAEIIKKKITDQNAAFLYHIAILYKSEDLEEFCLKYAYNHMTEVITSPEFGKLDAEIVKSFIIKAAQARVFRT